jgi:hypothetical protein
MDESYFTTEWLFSSVDALVLLEVFGVHECGVALLALVRPLASVHRAHVVVQQPPPLEALV